jgi:hypothetical protein
MGEAMDVAQFADRDHGRDQLKAAEGHEGLDGGLEPPVFQEGGHGSFDAFDPLVAQAGTSTFFPTDTDAPKSRAFVPSSVKLS